MREKIANILPLFLSLNGCFGIKKTRYNRFSIKEVGRRFCVYFIEWKTQIGEIKSCILIEVVGENRGKMTVWMKEILEQVSTIISKYQGVEKSDHVKCSSNGLVAIQACQEDVKRNNRELVCPDTRVALVAEELLLRAGL